MTRREWLDSILQLLRVTPTPAPTVEGVALREAPLQDETASIVKKASAVIRQNFGDSHQVAAETCVNVLLALIEITKKEKSLSFGGYTQEEIGRYCGRSGTTVGTYTRKLVELGLIKIEKTPRKKNGRFSSNRYWVNFLEKQDITYFTPEPGQDAAGYIIQYH